MKKLLLTAFVAVTSTMCFAQDYGLKTFNFIDDGYYYIRGMAMSTDGRYIAGEVGYNSEGTFVYDVETGDMNVYIATSATGSCAYGVSDTGVAATYDLGPMTFSIDGTAVALEGNQGEASFASDITPDGTIVVGGVTREDDSEMSGYYGHACYWIDAKQYLLPEPTAQELGLTVIEEDETDYAMDGTHALLINEDGSLIVGYFYDRWSQWPCIAWTRGDDGSYTCDPICAGYYNEDQWSQTDNDNPYYTFHPSGLSKNGKYIALDLALSNGDNFSRIGRFNMDTRELEVAEVDDYGFESSGVANDGTVLAKSTTGDAYIWRPDTDEPKRLRSSYPLATGLQDLDTQGENWPMSITPDGRYIMGWAWMYDENISTDTGYYCIYRLDTVQYENAAGIVSITNDEQDTTKAIYSVDGRRLSKLQPGINIVKKNGKTSKYLIR
ncbi:MAG: hypothetical protein LUC91_03580 [Prevotella sp.]|nr:hypothetical protein [Prevotella sp.]